MENKRKTILDIVDMQNGFMAPDGNLTLNCPEIAEKANEFFRAIPENAFDIVLIKRDTHFAGFYNKTDEGKEFPPHCIYGTKDWDMAIDTSPLTLKQNTYFMDKDAFDMWGTVDTGYTPQDEDFQSDGERATYKRLYGALGENEFSRRDDLLPQNMQDTTIYLMGVAADICNRFAIKGYLERGANVIVVDDLTKGLAKQTPEVVAELKEEMNLAKGRLTTIKAYDLIKKLRAEAGLNLDVRNNATAQQLRNER